MKKKLSYSLVSPLLKGLTTENKLSVVNNALGEFKQTPAMQLGTMIHEYIQGEWDDITDKYVVMTPKEYKESSQEYERTTNSVIATAENVIAELENSENPVMSVLDSLGGVFEAETLVENIKFKGFIDLYDKGNKVIVDIKTTGRFDAAMKYNLNEYRTQLGLYGALAGILDVGKFYVMLVETVEPYRSCILKFDTGKVLDAYTALCNSKALEWVSANIIGVKDEDLLELKGRLEAKLIKEQAEKLRKFRLKASEVIEIDKDVEDSFNI